MSIADFLLKSLIKHLQKIQKKRKIKRKIKHVSFRKPRKSAQRQSLRKTSIKRKRKTSLRRRRKVKRSSRKTARKSSRKIPVVKKKNGSPLRRKRIPGSSIAHPKIKLSTANKIRKTVAEGLKDYKESKEACVGEITHYFSRIKVVVLKMTEGRITIGDKIRIMGKGADFVQKVGSLQIESIDVKTARKGQLVGLKVDKVVKVGSKVYKVG